MASDPSHHAWSMIEKVKWSFSKMNFIRRAEHECKKYLYDTDAYVSKGDYLVLAFSETEWENANSFIANHFLETPFKLYIKEMTEVDEKGNKYELRALFDGRDAFYHDTIALFKSIAEFGLFFLSAGIIINAVRN